ncbi:MAG: hypothetical protein JNJ47_07465 [Alphaproteobacteria bacterium]|nr:hypothetical protein [Alphaproteobacteria bacterium]
MKTLTTFALLAVMAVSISGEANASLLNEGKQNFYFYFGTPCTCGTPMVTAVAAPCAVAPVNPCCCERDFFEGILY